MNKTKKIREIKTKLEGKKSEPALAFDKFIKEYQKNSDLDLSDHFVSYGKYKWTFNKKMKQNVKSFVESIQSYELIQDVIDPQDYAPLTYEIVTKDICPFFLDTNENGAIHIDVWMRDKLQDSWKIDWICPAISDSDEEEEE
jgi:hypothetical protein